MFNLARSLLDWSHLIGTCFACFSTFDMCLLSFGRCCILSRLSGEVHLKRAPFLSHDPLSSNQQGPKPWARLRTCIGELELQLARLLCGKCTSSMASTLVVPGKLSPSTHHEDVPWPIFCKSWVWKEPRKMHLCILWLGHGEQLWLRRERRSAMGIS